MSSKIEFYSSYGVQGLRCPGCGGEYLHQVGVEAFCREEDGQAVSVNLPFCTNEPAVTIRSMPDPYYLKPDERMPPHGHQNPSSRRQGLLVFFECEGCHSPLDEWNNNRDPMPPLYPLAIYQHKGITFVEWKLPDAG